MTTSNWVKDAIKDFPLFNLRKKQEPKMPKAELKQEVPIVELPKPQAEEIKIEQPKEETKNEVTLEEIIVDTHRMVYEIKGLLIELVGVLKNQYWNINAKLDNLQKEE